jgi:predicted 3-demethylubiquinone-9 3-methyltransferase (glyoxalase superfamily)
VTNITTLHDTPSGDCDVVSFVLADQPFMAISAGPLFKFNPSVSFHMKFKTKDEVDAIWERLSAGGKILMPLDAYPFSERYGWIEDKYGLSWQIWPTVIGEMMKNGTREQIDRITQAFLPMKKFDIATLQKAYDGT